jgi:hypothetical protein
MLEPELSMNAESMRYIHVHHAVIKGSKPSLWLQTAQKLNTRSCSAEEIISQQQQSQINPLLLETEIKALFGRL